METRTFRAVAALAALAALATPPPAAAQDAQPPEARPEAPAEVPANAWQLIFARATVLDAEGAGPALEAESVVLLAGDRMGVLDTERGERIWDFEHRRVHVLDRERGLRLLLSLYGEVAARERRLAAQDALRGRAAGGDAAALPSAAESESWFGMRGVEPARPEIREREEDGAVVYAVDGEDTVWFRPADEPLPEAARRPFERFLAWTVRMHPAVRERIVATGRLPVFLRTRYPSPQGPLAETLQLRAAGAASIDWARPFEGLRPGTLDDAPSSVAAHRVRAGELDAPPTFDSYLADARRRLAAGSALDAALAHEAAVSAHGRREEALDREIAAAGDPDAAALSEALAQLGNEPEAALGRLDALPAAELEFAHVLDLLRASAYDALGRTDLALARFDDALEADPYLAGGYCDLGRLHFRSERMPLAWLAWDAARALRPEHPSAAPVDALEASLVQRFPAFF